MVEQNIGHVNRLREIGAGIIGRAVTHTLYVSPNGSGLDGTTWAMAFKTLQEALAVASVSGGDCTLINISPHAAEYDIDTTGDPTWAGDYILKGGHRNWAKIKNSHASATALMRFTGKVALWDINLNLGTGGNGVIFTQSGWRLYHCQVVGEDLTSAGVGVRIGEGGSAAVVKHGRMSNCEFVGHVTHMTGIKMDKAAGNDFEHMHIHDCLAGVQIINAASDGNYLHDIDIGECAIGLDLDAGNVQHFDHIDFHGNTLNIDDEVGDHTWKGIHGNFDVLLLPDNFTGVGLGTHVNPDTWGTNTEILAAVSRSKPFRVTSLSIEADASEKFRVRLSSDAGTSHFMDIQIEGEANANKRESIQLPGGTDRILNYNTQISGSSKSESGGGTATVWLEIQEI